MGKGEEMNYNEKAAAKRLGIARQTLANWRHLGKGPAYIRLSTAIRYREEDLREYENRNRIDPVERSQAI